MSTSEITVYSVKQTAEILQTSCHQIRKMIQRKELPAVRVGREWRVPSGDLLAFLETGNADANNDQKEKLL